MMTLTMPTRTTRLHDHLAAGVQAARRLGTPVLVSLSEPLAEIDPLAFWAAGRAVADDRLYWAAPGGSLTLAGIGVAQAFSGSGPDRFATIADAWARLLMTAQIDGGLFAGQPGVGPTLMGGFAFDPQRPHTADWAGFPDGLLILPQLLLRAAGGVSVLTTSAVVTAMTDATAEADRLTALRAAVLGRADLSPQPPPLLGEGEQDGISPLLKGDRLGVRSSSAQGLGERSADSAWKAAVAAVAADIRAGALEKAVLARAVRVTSAEVFDPTAVLRRLAAKYGDCYVFAVDRGGHCFLGATPERLVRQAGDRVLATCLAGTARRGATPTEDAELGAALLTSSKNREEHAVVARMLAEALGAVCSDLQMPAAPVLLRLPNLQHLYTPIQGRLRPGIGLLDLVARLHPTPAVGGFPRATALAQIRAREGMDRGWYAGPVGWLDARGDGEFAVALRSALLDGATAQAFAGCGIMGDSDPDAEYAETQIKLRPILTALAEAQA
ncbi:MAG: isochorismate synthase [Chloroflexota bacterium]|nr:isochorismate synthase [Chloroflexota bacterium]